MKITFFGYTIINIFAVSKYTVKNWLVSLCLILHYGSSDLRFKSRKEFLIFAKFFKKHFNWSFSMEILTEATNLIGEGKPMQWYLFTGAKTRTLLQKHEEER